MRVPPLAEAISALLASAVTWVAWPWWSAQAHAWLPAVPGILGLVATYAVFRVVLAPVRAVFSWALAARVHPTDRPAE